MKSPEIERRILPLEVRQADDAARRIEGYATTFNQSYNLYWFHEVVHKGAFERTIEEDAQVFLNAHDLGQVLGNTRNDTFHLAEDDHGLRIVVALPDTHAGRDMYEMVRSRYIDGLSIGFEILDEDWDFPSNGGIPIRHLRLLKLFEASLTAFPANPHTEIDTQVARQRMMRAQQSLAMPAPSYASLESDRLFLARHGRISF